MKAMIYAQENQTSWLEKFFPEIHPYALKFTNKPILEYYLDFCVLHGIQEIRIILNHPNAGLQQIFGNGEKWGISISYGIARENDTIQKIILKNANFCQQEDILLFFGLFFLHYNKNKIEKNEILKFTSSKAISDDQSSLILLKNSKQEVIKDIKLPEWIEAPYELTSIENIKKYYQLSMNILTKEDENYFLPGYNSDSGIYLGQELIYPPTSTLTKNLIIGNQVQIKDNCQIGEHSIIGDNVIIDHDTVVRNSIIYDRSYIGSDLDIENKIVHKNCLIDPESEEILDVVDHFFISEIHHNLLNHLFYRISQSFFSILLMILFFIPYLLFLIVAKSAKWKKKTTSVYKNKKGDSIKIKRWEIENTNFIFHFYQNFLIDKYSLLPYAINHRLYLVGNQLLESTEQNKTILKNLPDYQPGVFSLPEMFNTKSSDFQYLLYELDYCNNISLKMDFRILKNTVKQRILHFGKDA